MGERDHAVPQGVGGGVIETNARTTVTTIDDAIGHPAGHAVGREGGIGVGAETRVEAGGDGVGPIRGRPVRITAIGAVADVHHPHDLGTAVFRGHHHHRSLITICTVVTEGAGRGAHPHQTLTERTGEGRVRDNVIRVRTPRPLRLRE